ncbi:MAG TPA: trigger factor [Candidatus Cybelea sp.]|nr:trigger factor [Candidatus Cybelea sp.]
MQVTQTSSEGLKREFKIVIGRSDIEQAMDAKLKELGSRVRMPGFRPGKVPQKLIKQQYGKSVMGEVLQESVSNATQQAIKDHALRPALQPRIEVTKFDDASDLEATVAIEIMPEIVPGDLSTLKLEKLVTDVEDAKVDEALTRIADQQKTFTVTSEPRAAVKGDAVFIDFVGKVNDAAFDGGTAQDFQLVLGSGSFIPGFEDQLIGAKAGEARQVKVTFPADYGAKELAGKDAVFDVSVKEVREANKVALDDELAKRLGLENFAALQDAVRKQIQQEHAGYTRARLKRNLLDALAERYDFDVPAGMVDIEFEQIWRQLQQDAGEQGIEKASGKSEDESRAEYRKIAERRVRLGLLLAEVGRLNNIEVQPDEVTRAMVEQARRFPGQERKVVEYFQNSPEAMAQLRAPLFEDKVVDFIVELAKVTERKVALDELMRDPDEDGANAAPDGKK